GVVVPAAGILSVVQSGRGPLRGDSARDGCQRRLGDPTTQRLEILRKAAVAVLGHGHDLRTVRPARLERAPVGGTERIFGSAAHGLDRHAPLRRADRGTRRAGAGRRAALSGPRQNFDARYGFDRDTRAGAGRAAVAGPAW